MLQNARDSTFGSFARCIQHCFAIGGDGALDGIETRLQFCDLGNGLRKMMGDICNLIFEAADCLHIQSRAVIGRRLKQTQ